MGASLSRVTHQQWLRIWLPGVADSKRCHWMRWPQPPGAQARNWRMEGTCLGPRWAPELVDPPAPVWGKLPLQASRPPCGVCKGLLGPEENQALPGSAPQEVTLKPGWGRSWEEPIQNKITSVLGRPQAGGGRVRGHTAGLTLLPEPASSAETPHSCRVLLAALRQRDLLRLAPPPLNRGSPQHECFQTSDSRLRVKCWG